MNPNDFPADHADKDRLITDDHLDGLGCFRGALFALGAEAVPCLIAWAVWRLF